jgi:hypothetical protein
MGWESLLATKEERALPWGGGRQIAWGARVWDIKGRLPPEHGWYKFVVDGTREIRLAGPLTPVEPDPTFEDAHKKTILRGYLVGDRLIPDHAGVNTDPTRLIAQTLPILLVEPGLDRFTRAVVVQTKMGNFYVRQEFPQGQEDDITAAYQDRLGVDAIAAIKGVTPALELAFRWLTNQRHLAEVREVELRKIREAEEKLRVAEERHAEALKSIGTGAGRRALATQDFPTAARAALAVSGAELLDARPSHTKGEWVVQYRFQARRLECVCDVTMHIIDAGICLADHNTGVKGDTRFTLESLPAVVGEAIALGKLVVWRHVAGDMGHNDHGRHVGEGDDDDPDDDW